MGMTIEETIPILHDMYNYYNDVDVDVDAYVGFDNEDNNAIETALDTMRKYEKIQEIVKEWREVGLEYDSCDAMMNIERVINNGNYS